LNTDVKETIADMKGIPTKDELMTMLKEDELVVTFLKLDGDRRVMTCTLHEDVVPPATKKDPLSQKKIRTISDKVCSVWDINAKGWRSFRYDRVEKVEQRQGELDV
tara:strand:- start:640 stop:957 length:318 start_codon:yes stop_codon:yes gene_type:complete